MRRPPPSAYLIPLALAWLALALRLYGLTGQGLWRDETDTLRFATRSLPQAMEMFRRPGENGPLYFLGMRPWLAAAGQSEFALRFPSAAAGVLAVPVIYVLIRRLAGPTAGLLTALLAATAPYLVWYGQEAKMYALLTALVPLSLWLTQAAAARGGWRWAALYAVTTISIYCHLLAALIVPVQTVWLLLLTASRRRRAALAYLALLILPYLPLAWWQAEMWLSDFETGHPFVPLGDILLILRSAFTHGILADGSTLAAVPSTLALLAGLSLWPMLARRDRPAVLLAVWLLLPPLAIYGVSLGMPIFLDRYLIWIAPAFLALAAAGALALGRLWRPLTPALIAAILAWNVVGVATQASQIIKPDFRGAAAFVAAHAAADDLLIFQIAYNRPTFTYYAGERWQMFDGPVTDGLSQAELDNAMTEGVGRAAAAWLVASEAEMWDSRGLTQGWLAAHGAVTDQAEFNRVSVTRYQLSK